MANDNFDNLGREQNKEVQDVQFYKQAYEQEKARAASLAGRLADAKNEADSLQFQLDRIKNNPLWKASKPLRQTMHWGLRNYRRVRNLGGPKGIARKLKQKKIEAEAKKTSRYSELSHAGAGSAAAKCQI